MKEEKVYELILDRILTQGKEGAASGIIQLQSGEIYAFSDFYKFNNAKGTKLSALTSFVIKV